MHLIRSIRATARTTKVTAVLLLTTAVVTLVPSSAFANGPRPVTDHYTVDGLTVPGVDTGFIVKPGLPITVTGGGAICPFGGNPANSYCPGADGNPSFDTTQSSYGGFLLPGAPAWGLVGRVGDGPWVQIGAAATTLSGSGPLVFAANDDLYRDNTGTFTVTVAYTCYPGNGNGDKNHYHC